MYIVFYSFYSRLLGYIEKNQTFNTEEDARNFIASLEYNNNVSIMDYKHYKDICLCKLIESFPN